MAYTIDFTGKGVVVLGGGTGIGAAIARAFVEAGAHLAVSYFGEETAAHEIVATLQAAGRRSLLRQLDSREVPAIEAFVDDALQALGAIDVLVYNAGLTDPQPIFEITEEQWDQTLDINLKGMFFCARRVAMHQKRLGTPGAMVLLSSVHSIRATGRHTHYAVSKAGVNMLAHSLALQLAPYQIRVNAIAPGSIYVERHAAQKLYDPEELGRGIPLGRVGTPEDIAELALYLASEHAGYVTGQVVVADGGLTLPMSRLQPPATRP